MGSVVDDDHSQENTLTSSDLRGLLKAASLTEFRPDAVPEDAEATFVKSNSLFDLVRSNLLDNEPSKSLDDSENTADRQALTVDEIKRSSLNELVDDETPPIHGVGKSENLNLTSESEDSGSITSENSFETQNVVDLNSGNSKDDNLAEHDRVPGVEDAFERSILVDDVKGDTAPKVPLTQSEEFLQELQKLQLEFDRQLDDKMHTLAKTAEALFGASNLIVVEMENQISDFVLSLASDLAGTKIDKLPAAYFKKIARVAKQIAGNENEVTIHLNPDDYKVVNSSKNLIDFNYKFQEKDNLKRGEFEVLSHKSTAGILLFSASAEV